MHHHSRSQHHYSSSSSRALRTTRNGSSNNNNTDDIYRSSSRSDHYDDHIAPKHGDDVWAVNTLRSMHVDGNTEWERSGRTVRHGGVKSKLTRTVRKVTTVTRGEQSVTSESVMRYESGDKRTFPGLREDKKSLKFRVVDDKVVGKKIRFWNLVSYKSI